MIMRLDECTHGLFHLSLLHIPRDGTQVMACDLRFLGLCSIGLSAEGRAVHGMLI